MPRGRVWPENVTNWTPELMTQRLMSAGYDVRVSCKGDLWRFEATRERNKWAKTSARNVIYLLNGRIVLPNQGEI